VDFDKGHAEGAVNIPYLFRGPEGELHTLVTGSQHPPDYTQRHVNEKRIAAILPLLRSPAGPSPGSQGSQVALVVPKPSSGQWWGPPPSAGVTI
jgi:hypothetical protein